MRRSNGHPVLRGKLTKGEALAIIAFVVLIFVLPFAPPMLARFAALFH